MVDDTLTVLATHSVPQRIVADASGASEHVPEATWKAVAGAIRTALARAPGRQPEAVSVTGPRGTFCVTDARGVPRSPFLTWQDSRSAAEADELRRTAPTAYAAITGMDPAPSSVLPKLIWLRAKRPDLFTDVWQVQTPQGFVMGRLGAPHAVVDASTAAHVGLLDLARLAWSDELLHAFEVELDNLPEVLPQGAIAGVTGDAARGIGLPAGIPIVAAGSDGICSELGAGVTRPGELYAYLGTAGAVAGPVRPGISTQAPGIFRMPGSVPDLHRLVGLALAGGSAAAWFMRTHGVRTHAQLDQLVGRSPVGARGAVFVPTLAGASLPRPDGRARGSFVGLSPSTSRADLARAVLEGVAMELASIAQRIQGSGQGLGSIALTGGGSRSDTWAQIVADAFGRRVARVREPNPGLRGAAIYAFSALEAGTSPVVMARRHPADADAYEPEAAAAVVYASAGPSPRNSDRPSASEAWMPRFPLTQLCARCTAPNADVLLSRLGA